MADKDLSIVIKNYDVIVPQNSDYVFEFLINKPVSNSVVTKTFIANSEELEDGKLVRYSLNKSQWKSLLDVKLK